MENHRLSLSWHRGIRSSIRPCLITTCSHQCVLLKRCYRISSGRRVLEEARGRAHHSRETARETGDYETRRVGAPRPRRSPQRGIWGTQLLSLVDKSLTLSGLPLISTSLGLEC